MFEDFKPTSYALESVKSGVVFDDQGWTLDAPGEGGTTLVRAVYANQQLNVKDASFGIFRFSDWLPVHRMAQGSSAPATPASAAYSLARRSISSGAKGLVRSRTRP